jgi:uncharacterized protein
VGLLGNATGQGLNRQVYPRMFLRSRKPKALAKLAQHPGLFNRERRIAARDLYAVYAELPARAASQGGG